MTEYTSEINPDFVETLKELAKPRVTTTEEFFSDIDWPQLREQKLALIAAADTDPQLEGLINLLDHIQDHAVNVLGVPEKDVFLTEKEED